MAAHRISLTVVLGLSCPVACGILWWTIEIASPSGPDGEVEVSTYDGFTSVICCLLTFKFQTTGNFSNATCFSLTAG